MRALLLLLAVAVMGEPTTDFKANGFRYQGSGFRIEGAEVEKKGSRVVVKDARLIIESKDDLILITTPELEFDLTTKRGYGKGKVKVRGRRIIMSGVGFNVNAGKKHFSIRSKVRTTLLGGSDKVLILGDIIETSMDTEVSK